VSSTPLKSQFQILAETVLETVVPLLPYLLYIIALISLVCWFKPSLLTVAEHANHTLVKSQLRDGKQKRPKQKRSRKQKAE
jgi:hypothetical protein